MPLRIYRRRLPHWRVEGATYWVSWRLHRSQPRLRPPERECMLDVLRHFDGTHFTLHAAVVMDDHVHVVVTPRGSRSLQRIIQSWKSFGSARLRASGRGMPCWQMEYYDRVIRSEADFRQKVNYVVNNPRRRWPGIRDYPWIWIREENR